ncbi:glycoside hydrolase family 76 protein [Armillaria novae-zelandiae]|uniref:Glycoside hydrolase family 76 protein n=1 Tax=Armillaria novae-zelandiae TaxID=153914 RepID=A0AA39P398_9AGAR|nr:glycoside hydrolase family 76 protein [Armillaria novae-zelandiae]
MEIFILLSLLLSIASDRALGQFSIKPSHTCPKTTRTAFEETHHLMNLYYNWTSGRLNGGSVWTDANALETVHTLMLQNKRTDWDGFADNSYLGRHALNTSSDWQAFTGGYIDDAGWCILDLWAMADYKTFRSENGVEEYLRQLYDKMAENWDNTCGGGVWWTTDHGYKNAITNELFLTISAQGYLRFGNQTYLENAKKTWAWLEASGMRNSEGLYNDGLDDSCINNGETTWTYNQGVLASGLGALWKATGNRTLLKEAEITLDATIKYMTVNRSAERIVGPFIIRTDVMLIYLSEQTFKACVLHSGIWTKHLQYYLIFTNEKEKIAKYGPFLGTQSHAVIEYATNATGDISNLWYAPDEGGAIYNVKSLPSGIMAHVAAAQFGGYEGVDLN